MNADAVQITSFANVTAEDKKNLKRFVDFHWTHYRNEAQYIPLLDYEYLGFRLIGMTGFFERRNLFFQHGDIRFFLAYKNGDVVGRCTAFINENHNKHWNEKIGFFGHFESTDDQEVADALIDAASEWVKSKGMNALRGPQNFPVNEATPGALIEGFDTRPVIYYHYNKPYYQKLLSDAGMQTIKRVVSWEVPVMNPMEERLERVANKVVQRYGVTFEHWKDRPLEERKREMFEIYNDAWSDNFGFVPFTQEEFYAIVGDMMLIMDSDLFLFVYVKGESAAFFGAVPNVFEKMTLLRGCRRCELLRAAKMLLTKGSVKGFRLGYLGVRKKFRRLGLDGVMLRQQKIIAQKRGYEYCDMGWTLEDNVLIFRLAEMMNARLSKKYALFQKSIV